MADWDHIINSITSANMAKVNTVAKSGIEKINQVSTTPPVVYTGTLFFDMLATEEELKLTYEEFVNKRVEEFYVDNNSIFDGKTNEEKEEILLNLVGEGDLFADVAIRIAGREGLDVE